MFLLKSLHGEADRKVPAQPEIFFNPVDPATAAAELREA